MSRPLPCPKCGVRSVLADAQPHRAPRRRSPARLLSSGYRVGEHFLCLARLWRLPLSRNVSPTRPGPNLTATASARAACQPLPLAGMTLQRSNSAQCHSHAAAAPCPVCAAHPHTRHSRARSHVACILPRCPCAGRAVWRGCHTTQRCSDWAHGRRRCRHHRCCRHHRRRYRHHRRCRPQPPLSPPPPLSPSPIDDEHPRP